MQRSAKPPQVTRRMAEGLARHADLHEPNRARAVLSYLDSVEAPIAANHEERRRRGRKRSSAKAKQRRKQWVDPDPREKEIRELNRMMRAELERAPGDDGEIVGPLTVAARYAVPQLLKDFRLDETHAQPLEMWLLAKLGDCFRDEGLDVPGYLAWREACRAAVSSDTPAVSLD